MGEAGKDAEVPRCCAEDAGWDGSGWDSLPESPSRNWNRRDEKQGLFVLPDLAWREKGQELFGSLPVHFLSVFPGEERLKRTLASFGKPLLGSAAVTCFEHC